MGTAEKLQLLNQHLLTGSFTKERFLRLDTRYVLTDRIYGSNAQNDHELASRREEWLRVGDVQMPMLTNKIEGATRVDKLQPSHETSGQHFDRLLRESSGDQIDQTEERPEKPCSKACSTRKRVLPESENTADQPCSSETSAKKSKSSTDQRAAEELETIRGEIRMMKSVLDKYQRRLIVECSKGIDPRIDCSFCGVVGAHFSDSCPHVVKGNQRLQVAISCGRCYKCMKFCSGTCSKKEREKGCFYCKPLRGTPFEDVIPPYVHHRAVCPAPDLREELQLRLVEKVEELTELKRVHFFSRRDLRNDLAGSRQL
uniref:Zinc finger domain containing protein n=1 Tax=Haemonchus contortus TaxID=6289 RepID=A0A7I4XUY2_HAECO